MRVAALLLLLVASACEQPGAPKVGAGVSITPSGIRISPAARVNVGGVGVKVSP